MGEVVKGNRRRNVTPGLGKYGYLFYRDEERKESVE